MAGGASRALSTYGAGLDLLHLRHDRRVAALLRPAAGLPATARSQSQFFLKGAQGAFTLRMQTRISIGIHDVVRGLCKQPPTLRAQASRPRRRRRAAVRPAGAGQSRSGAGPSTPRPAPGEGKGGRGGEGRENKRIVRECVHFYFILFIGLSPERPGRACMRACVSCVDRVPPLPAA